MAGKGAVSLVLSLLVVVVMVVVVPSAGAKGEYSIPSGNWHVLAKPGPGGHFRAVNKAPLLPRRRSGSSMFVVGLFY